MSQKFTIWLGVFVGGTVGSYIPVLFDAGLLSLFSVIASTIGGLAGIWVGYKLSQWF